MVQIVQIITHPVAQMIEKRLLLSNLQHKLKFIVVGHNRLLAFPFPTKGHAGMTLRPVWPCLAQSRLAQPLLAQPRLAQPRLVQHRLAQPSLV